MHKDVSNNTVLNSFAFTLDSSGKISQVLHADNTKWVYTCDARHRVTEGDLKDSGNNNVRTHGYTYDAANNMTAKTRVITSPYSSSSWTYGYDDANEQLTVNPAGGTTETRTYDAWGRVATRTQGTSSATFNYRYGGKLYSYATNFGGETAETMQYRGDGRLYSRNTARVAKFYHYDRGWNAINEEDDTGYLTATSVYAPGAEVGERLAYSLGTVEGGLIAYAYHDQVGSTRVWRWYNKNLVGKDEFGPYGEAISSTTLMPIDYALHVQDPYTQLYHAPYREYGGGWARWTTRDPMGMIDGPNMYAYVGDRPIGAFDPLGLKCNDEFYSMAGVCGVALIPNLLEIATIYALFKCATPCSPPQVLAWPYGTLTCVGCLVAVGATEIIIALMSLKLPDSCACMVRNYLDCMQGRGGYPR